MNGRLYDAKLGRFLSPDNFVQDPFSTQSFNRYGYVVNNPLSFSDESGEFILAAVLIGAFVNIFMQGISGNINSIGDFFLAGAIGAASGFLGAGVASLAAGGTFLSGAVATGFMQGAFAGAASGLTAGFVGGAGNAWMNGASFGDGLMAGLKAGVSGMFIGAAVGGVTGGIKANKMGLDFMKGDIVKDAAKFNNLFKSEIGAVACTDCASGSESLIGKEGMFQNGESIRGFRADLSGSDDFGQAFKAFKKAHLMKGTKMGGLFDFSTQDGWVKNGWELTGGNNGKTYIKHFLDGKYRLVVRASGISNFKTAGLFRGSLGKLGSDIFIGYKYYNSNELAQPLAQWIFPNSNMYDALPNSVFRGMISPW
jgi:hypothetical protein